MSGPTKRLIVICFDGSYTSLYKCLRNISLASSFHNALSFDVFIDSFYLLSAEEKEKCKELERISIIDISLINTNKYKDISVMTASTLVSPDFIAANVKMKDAILLPRFLVRIGNEFSIEDISYPKSSTDRLMVLNSHIPLWAGLRFIGRFAKNFLKTFNSANGEVNKALGQVSNELNSVLYVKDSLSFFRVDNDTDHYKRFLINTLSRADINTFLSNSIPSYTNLHLHVKTCKNEFLIPVHLKSIGVSNSIIHCWSYANTIDPQIRPSHVLLDDMLIESSSSRHNAGTLYESIMKTVPFKKYKYLVLLPHARTGGADKAALTFLQFLGKKNNTLALTTEENSYSTRIDEWNESPGVSVVDISRLFIECPVNDRLEALRLVVGAINPKSVDVINSQMGYDLISSPYTSLNSSPAWRVHAYAHVYEEGYMIPPFHNGLCETYEKTKTYITDSEFFKRELMNLYGFLNNRVKSVCVPIDMHVKKNKYDCQSRILWVGRVCPEKLIDVLLRVGAELYPNDIVIDIWGPIEENYISQEKLESSPGINYMGIYNNIEEVDFNDYDMLLLTSINEGIPNVVVEAAAAGMFVVAPKVGGVPEIITDGVNGLLVDDKLNHTEYVSAIMRSYNEGLYNKRVLIDFSLQVAKKHAYKSYTQSMNMIDK